MGRANALSAIVKSGLESKDDGREKPENVPASTPTPTMPQATAEPAPVKASTSREGKKFLSIYVEPEYHKRLRQAGLNHDLQVQQILRQALDDWMKKHNA